MSISGPGPLHTRQPVLQSRSLTLLLLRAKTAPLEPFLLLPDSLSAFIGGKLLFVR